MAGDVSRDVVMQRIHNRILEYFVLVASEQEQIDYQTAVPHVNVVVELIEMWEDWVPYEEPRDHFTAPAFTPEEVDAVSRFHCVWKEVVAARPGHAPYCSGHGS